MIRELQTTSRVFIAVINWWNAVDPKLFYEFPGDHAGELETSVMLEISPDLMLPISEAGSGHARKFAIAGLKDGLAWTPRKWTQVTDDTGSGDPSAGTKEKGARHLEAVTSKIGEFLVDLAAADTSRLYE